MKDYKSTYPNPNDDDQPESENQDGEGARPSSLVAVHRPKVIDPLHELNLLRMMQVANERTTRELGPLPPGGLPVPDKRKPTAPYMDFLGRVVPDVKPIVEENYEMRLKKMAAAATLTAGMVACDAPASTATVFSVRTETVAQTQKAAPSDDGQDQDDSADDMPRTYWQTFKPQFRDSFDAQWRAAKTTEEKLAAIKEELGYQDKLLNDRYKELRTVLPEKDWESMRDEQREWLSEVIRVCDKIITDRLESANCRLHRTAVRASELDVAIAIKKHQR